MEERGEAQQKVSMYGNLHYHFLLSTILYRCKSWAYYLSQLVFLLAKGHFQQEQQLWPFQEPFLPWNLCQHVVG